MPRLEAGAFAAYGSLSIDECYTVSAGGQHHTLVHLKKKGVESAVLKFMAHYGAAQEPARAIECSVFGFSGSIEKSGLYEHPSFRALVEQHRLSGGAPPSATYYSWLERPGIHYGGIMACYMKKAGGGGGVMGNGIVSEVGDDFLV